MNEKSIEDFFNVAPRNSVEGVLKEHADLPDDFEFELVEQEEIELLDESFEDEANKEALVDIEKNQEKLAMIQGKDHSVAMDSIYKETHQYAKEIYDMAYNSEPRMQRGLFEQAANMYGKAIDAKNSKRDSQLKAMKLALDQKKLELEELRLRQGGVIDETSKNNNFIIEDRNEIIKRALLEMKKD